MKQSSDLYTMTKPEQKVKYINAGLFVEKFIDDPDEKISELAKKKYNEMSQDNNNG